MNGQVMPCLQGRTIGQINFTIRKVDNGFIVEGYKESFGSFCCVFSALVDAQEFITKNI